MKAYLLFTATGAEIILTDSDSIKDPNLLNMLDSKGITKFVAHELPLDLVKERFGAHFDKICNDLEQSDALRVLEEDGLRVYNLFSFQELGKPIYHEPEVIAKQET